MVHLVMYTPEVIRALYDFLKNKVPNNQLPHINWDELNVYDEATQQQLKAKIVFFGIIYLLRKNINRLLVDKTTKRKGYLKTNYKGIIYKQYYSESLLAKKAYYRAQSITTYLRTLITLFKTAYFLS